MVSSSMNSFLRSDVNRCVSIGVPLASCESKCEHALDPSDGLSVSLLKL